MTRLQENNEDDIPLLARVIGPALHAAFLKAVELAKQTRTYLVIEKDGVIERIPYDKIDDYLAERNQNQKNIMDAFVEKKYLEEIIRQANRALFCMHAINVF